MFLLYSDISITLKNSIFMTNNSVTVTVHRCLKQALYRMLKYIFKTQHTVMVYFYLHRTC